MRLHNIFMVTLIIIGIMFRVKNIKDLKFLKISIFYMITIIYLVSVVIEVFIIPLPTYYIKAKDEFQIERVIEKEMVKSGIDFDMGTVSIINYFSGKYNKLYLCRYENQGAEEVRMFDFKQNIFGNLKPAHNFSDSRIVLRGETDTRHDYRRIQEGLGTYYIYYGFGTEPFWEDGDIGEFKIRNVNPEGYYLLMERYDHTPSLIWQVMVLVMFFLIIYSKNKKEKLRDSYKVVKVLGRRGNILEIEYYS